MKVFRCLLAFAALTAVVASPCFAKDGDQTTEGTIGARSASSVTVGGVQFVLTSGTECWHQLIRISCSALSVGDSVEIKWRNDHVVREIERRSVGSNPSPTPSPSATPAPSASPTPSPGMTPQPSATPVPSPTGDDNGGRSNDDGGRTDDNGGRSNDDSSSGNGREIKARLVSIDQQSQTQGKAEFLSKRKESRLNIHVYVAEGTNPHFESIEEAQNAELTAVLSAGGVDYARCILRADNTMTSKRIMGTRVAAFEFKLDVRQKRASLRQKKGECDLDLALEGVQSGIPAVRRGHSIRVSDPLVGDFLNGTF